jgi:hypothetical protein
MDNEIEAKTESRAIVAAREGLHPWEKQGANETDVAWRAFRAYLEMPMGKRSTRKLARALGCEARTLHRWSVRHTWQARCRAHDAYLAQVATEAEAGAVIQRAGGWAAAAERCKLADWAMSAKLREQAEALLARLSKSADGSFGDLVKVTELASRLARRASGLADGGAPPKREVTQATQVLIQLPEREERNEE